MLPFYAAVVILRWLDGEVWLTAWPKPSAEKKAQVAACWEYDERIARGDDRRKARKDFIARWEREFGGSGEWALEHLGKYRALYKQYGFRNKRRSRA